MTTRAFAQWVAPSAEQLRQSRSDIARTARQLLPEHWKMLSPLEGWSYKDLLAHLATGDWVFQTVLRAVTANERFDLAEINPDYVNAGNARLLEERKERAVEELIAEVETEGERTQELLAKLTDADENRTQEGAPMSLAEGVRSFPGHDRDHLAQLKTVLDSVML
jgi:ribosomal 50S subunit-associated protein YjgA (DUF615 family)